MKTIATIQKDGRTVGIISGPDAADQSFVVNGRTWRFDFDDYCGPLWLRKNGEPRKCQCPTVKAVWDAFQVWHNNYKKSK
jgi:hypothetical protein